MIVVSLNEVRKNLYKGTGLIKIVSWKKVLPYTQTRKCFKKIFIDFLLNRLNINFNSLFTLFP